MRRLETTVSVYATETFLREIRENATNVDWDYISSQSGLSEGFIATYADSLDWSILCQCRLFTPEQSKRFSKYIKS